MSEILFNSDHEYSIEGQNDKVKVGSRDWIHGFSSLEKYVTSPTDKSISIFLNGTDFMENFDWNTEWKKPVKILHKGGLGMKMPPPGFDIQDLESFVDDEQTASTIDIYAQEIIEMNLKTFFEKWKQPSRSKLFNVLRWDFSGSLLADFIEPPEFLHEFSWVDKIWGLRSDDDEYSNILHPDHESNRLSVSMYCLLGMAGSFVNFHLAFGGSSVWYHVFKGQKIVYLLPPTKANLKAYIEWIRSCNKDETFMPNLAPHGELKRIVVNEGETILIPSGWICAVLTPEDSIVFGGNFLHELNIRMQLRIYQIEKKSHVGEDFAFPNFELINWYAARMFVKRLTAANEKNQVLPKHLISGLTALHAALNLWKERTLEDDNCNHPYFHAVATQLGDELTEYSSNMDSRGMASVFPTKPSDSRKKKPKPVIWINENDDVEAQLESEIIPGLLGITPGGRRPKRKAKNQHKKTSLIYPQAISRQVSVPYKPLRSIFRPFPGENFDFLYSKPSPHHSPSPSFNEYEGPSHQDKVVPIHQKTKCTIL